MKYKLLFFILILSVTSCSKDNDLTSKNTTDFRQNMRDFVIEISKYSKAINPNFNIIPQNGIELITSDGTAAGQPNSEYLNAIDANGQEELLYGYDNDDQATPSATISYLKGFLNVSKNKNKKILVTDYAWTASKMNNSYLENNNSGYVSFAANHRELDNIPTIPATIYHENRTDITSMLQVKNFLYLINPSGFTSRTEFINAVKTSNYDLIIMDLFFNDGTTFTKEEIDSLKTKTNGAKRLVVSYISIGEAENYRYYWNTNWTSKNPSWLDTENPDWKGNFKVKYWDQNWQKIIYGNDNSYIKKIINASFDGAYLDIIDAFEFYEK